MIAICWMILYIAIAWAIVEIFSNGSGEMKIDDLSKEQAISLLNIIKGGVSIGGMTTININLMLNNIVTRSEAAELIDLPSFIMLGGYVIEDAE